MEVQEKRTTSKRIGTAKHKPENKKLRSKMFSPAKEEYSDEEILAACPEQIDSKKISLKGSSYNFRRQLLQKYRAKGKKYKWFNENDRIEAASVYALTGNAKRVEEITGIPSERVRAWKQSDWWPQIIDRIRNEKDDELDVKLTKMIDKSVQAINDRLDHGDYVYDTKTKELSRKPLGGKEMSVMTSIFVDKRELLRKEKQVKTEQTTVNDRLKKLAEEFGKFVKMRTIEGEANAVQEESGEQTSEEVLVVIENKESN